MNLMDGLYVRHVISTNSFNPQYVLYRRHRYFTDFKTHIPPPPPSFNISEIGMQVYNHCQPGGSLHPMVGKPFIDTCW